MMDGASHSYRDPCLAFFGVVIAAMTHELKNSLAIIRENAGLMDDFAEASREGIPLDPARLEQLAERIRDHVARAVGVTQRMSELAHRTDNPCSSVEVSDLLQVTVALLGRAAYLRGVTLERTPLVTPAKIETDPFAVVALVGTCLGRAISGTAEGGSVLLAASSTADGVRLEIECAPAWTSPETNSPAETALAVSLGARILESNEGHPPALLLPLSAPIAED